MLNREICYIKAVLLYVYPNVNCFKAQISNDLFSEIRDISSNGPKLFNIFFKQPSATVLCITLSVCPSQVAFWPLTRKISNANFVHLFLIDCFYLK